MLALVEVLTSSYHSGSLTAFWQAFASVTLFWISQHQLFRPQPIVTENQQSTPVNTHIAPQDPNNY
jgi:uncharacterized membrane protein